MWKNTLADRLQNFLSTSRTNDNSQYDEFSSKLSRLLELASDIEFAEGIAQMSPEKFCYIQETLTDICLKLGGKRGVKTGRVFLRPNATDPAVRLRRNEKRRKRYAEKRDAERYRKLGTSQSRKLGQ